jgi:type IX secretion system PorP/SprF family membrane protein
MKNIKNNNIVLIVCILFFACTCSAQYQLNNRMVQQNKFGINPAYAGELEKTRIALVSNFTPTKLDNANKYFWQQATLEIPLKNNLYIGTVFSNITQGNFSQVQIKQAFAYKVRFSENQTLSVGFSFGLNRESLNYKSGFNPNGYVDLSDPYLNKDNYSENNLGLEVGAVYKYKNFQIALAMPALLQDNGNYRGVTAYTDYKFVINEEWHISPSVLMLQTEQSQYEFTTSVNATYMNKCWFQMGYVDVSQFVVGLGINLKGLGVSYNISVPFDSNYNSVVGNTHQLGLFFNL